tara:strand:+ start:128 stop:442 length:315 start_codon:yes stop_codon:yes gene_type:complete
MSEFNNFKMIKDLIIFYVKENYKQYLKENNLQKVSENQISNIVNQLYIDKKKHLKEFILKSMNHLLKDKYPGDNHINNILREIFNDDDLCKNKLIKEIIKYQNN